ncbi:MAG: hypothetical protein Q9192_006255, partial [Flavoplaca navasiana]
TEAEAEMSLLWDCVVDEGYSFNVDDLGINVPPTDLEFPNETVPNRIDEMVVEFWQYYPSCKAHHRDGLLKT